MSAASPIFEPEPVTCANCGATVEKSCCPECGQHRRGGQRLVLRDVLARFVEHLWDFDSAFLRTWLDLNRKPGVVCRDYIRGRRKFYMNPFGYLLLAMTVALFTESLIGRWFPATVDPHDQSVMSHPLFWLGYTVPWAVVWKFLFRRSGFNFAENYVAALYVVGHTVWFELLLTPLEIAGAHDVTMWLLVAILLGYSIWTGVGLYREPVWKVTLKMLASLFVVLVVVLIALAIMTALGVIGES
jgi:hypothetical protein